MPFGLRKLRPEHVKNPRERRKLALERRSKVTSTPDERKAIREELRVRLAGGR